MSIDTHLDAAPSDIRSSATDIGSIKTHVDSCEDNLISGRNALCELEGLSAGSATTTASQAITSCEDLVADLGSYKTALEDFASSLDAVKTSLADIRDRATAGGLSLSGEVINEPTSSFPDGPDPTNAEQVQQDSDEQAKIALYNTLETETHDIRTKETEARQTFSDACAAITGENSLATAVANGLSPSSGPGWATVPNIATWGIARAGNIAMLTEGAILNTGNARVRKLPAGIVRGSWGTLFNNYYYNSFQNIRHDSKLSNWSLPRSAQGSRAATALSGARAVGTAAKYAGRASTVLTFATSAYEQWEKDSHNPSMGEGEKAARAGTKGAFSAGGAWGGAAIGAKGGAAIGVCIGGPVGAAVGGVIGGVVGGAIGSNLGSSFADKVISWL